MDENEPIRKRIVINLDSPPPKGGQRRVQPGGARRTKLWPKVLAFLSAFLIVLVLVAAGGGFLWWRHYQTTPAYSLALMIDAAQRNEMTAFEQRIDDEEIAKRMIATVGPKVTNRYGVTINSSLQRTIDSLLPGLMPRVKQTIHEEVAGEIREFAGKSDPKPFILVALAVPSLIAITTDGDSAKASAKLKDRTIELGLRRDGDRWKVNEVNDDVLVQRIVDSLMKELPAIGRDGMLDLLKKPLGSAKRKR